MNDLRSPSEDRPYRPASQSPRLAQDDVDPEYGMSVFDRIRYSRWFPLASVFAAVLIFSGIVSYAYKQGSQTGVNATTPVVMADSKDYKEKPANPGGMDVPFQDAVVFDQLQNKGQTPTDGKTESLLPPPEQPVANGAAAPATTPAATETTTAAATATPVVPATTPAASAPAGSTTATPTPATNATTPAAPSTTATTAAAPAPSMPVPATAPVAAATAPAEEEEEAPAPAPVKKAAPAKKAVVAKATPAAAAPKAEAGTYRIQLGAFRDESAARSAWSKVAKQYSSLSGVTSAFPRADLGAKGVFYRAQGINLSKSSADSLCHTINANKAGSCIVTH
jgi:hypothetical protein